MNPRIEQEQAGIRQHLVNQLVFFDERRMEFIAMHFPGPSRDRAYMEKKLLRYSKAVETLLQNENDALFEKIQETVWIGSRVTIHCQDDGYEETVELALPHEADVSPRISILSPIGKKLLLSSADEILEIETPSRTFSLQVKSIDNGRFLDG